MAVQKFAQKVYETREQRLRREAYQVLQDLNTEAAFHAAYKATKRARKLTREAEQFLDNI